MKISRIIAAAAALAFTLTCTLTTAPALAGSGSPHFVSATGTIGDDGSLNVSMKEAGLGNVVITITLSSIQANSTWACINGGGNHPSAANKETVGQSESASRDFTPHNGSISGTVSLPAPGPGAFSCPSGQTLQLAYVTYTGVTLEDVTDTIFAFQNQTFSRCFETGKLAADLCG